MFSPVPLCWLRLPSTPPRHQMPANKCLRTKLHSALARLVFQQPPETMGPAFTAFMEPILSVRKGARCKRGAAVVALSRTHCTAGNI